MGNSEVGHLNIGAGPAGAPGPAPDRRRDRRRLVLRAARAPGGVPARAGGARPAQRRRPGRARAGSTPTTGTSSPSPSWRGARACPRSGSTRCSTAATRRRARPSGSWPTLERRLAAAHPDARIASVGGRYFAMDRDHRWERTEARLRRDRPRGGGARRRARARRSRLRTSAAIGDEFVPPTVIDPAGAEGRPHDGPIGDGEPIVHANFRADRARQLTHALADPAFDAFDRASPDGRPAPRDLLVVTMTEYEAGPAGRSSPSRPRSCPASPAPFAAAGWRQLHVAETEKYAHVTYFLNGGREAPFAGEDRVLVPSPKVATYDLQPEMSAPGVDRRRSSRASPRSEYDVLVANYANPDMVGHTGDWDATVRAVEAVDARARPDRRRPRPATDSAGRAPRRDRRPRQRRRDARRPTAARSRRTRSTPCRSSSPDAAVDGRSLGDGVLADVAPTLLELAGLPGWPGITGRSLLAGLTLLPSAGVTEEDPLRESRPGRGPAHRQRRAHRSPCCSSLEARASAARSAATRRLPQPARDRAAALAVHDRPDRACSRCSRSRRTSSRPTCPSDRRDLGPPTAPPRVVHEASRPRPDRRPQRRARRPLDRRARAVAAVVERPGRADAERPTSRSAPTSRASSAARRTRARSAPGPRRIARSWRSCSGGSSASARAARSSATSPRAGRSTTPGAPGRSTSGRASPGRTASRSPSDDVAFTVDVLSNPAYTGPGAESWRDVTGARSSIR